jgi:hypothetical protein
MEKLSLVISLQKAEVNLKNSGIARVDLQSCQKSGIA